MNKRYVLALLFSVLTFACQAQGAFSIGPMLHLNLNGKGQNRVSFGVEAAYWDLDHFPYSIDGGLDFEKNKFRIYSELQTGIGLLGVAAGPVLEKTKGEPLALGWQGNIWANYYMGVNVRGRFIKGKNVFAPGIYAKLPIGFGFGENEEDDTDWSDLFD